MRLRPAEKQAPTRSEDPMIPVPCRRGRASSASVAATSARADTAKEVIIRITGGDGRQIWATKAVMPALPAETGHRHAGKVDGNMRLTSGGTPAAQHITRRGNGENTAYPISAIANWRMILDAKVTKVIGYKCKGDQQGAQTRLRVAGETP